MKKKSSTPAVAQKEWRIAIINAKSEEGTLYLGNPIGSTPIWWRDPGKAKRFTVKAEAEEYKKTLAYKKEEGYRVTVEPIIENNNG